MSNTTIDDSGAPVPTDENASPYMTHLVELVEGNTLPQIAQQIYGSPAYNLQVAELDGLNKFRQLQPGSTLVVPPLMAEGDTNDE